MSTNSRIGIVNADGTVTSIYCHWDGYLTHNGLLLASFWTEPKKIAELMQIGNISSLGTQLPLNDPLVLEMVNRTCIHMVDPRVHVCRAYGRQGEEARKYSMSEFKNLESYNYYYDPTKKHWYCWTWGDNRKRFNVDVARFIKDRDYFLQVYKQMYGAAFENNKQGYLEEWKETQEYFAYYIKCMTGKCNVMNNLCEALNEEFRVPADTYTGAIVKHQQPGYAKYTYEYIIYDILQSGQKRRKRLATADNPLVCTAKAYAELKRREDCKRQALGVK